jgi:hypothetical protein
MSEDKDNYKKMCNLWLKSYTWILSDAISIIHEELPAVYLKHTDDEKTKKSRGLVTTLVKNNLGGAIDIQKPVPDDEPEVIRVNPVQFLDWVESFGFPLPHILNQARQEFTKEQGKPSRKLTPMQIHKHRCRSLAEYFWEQDPDITKADMAQKPDLLEIACENKRYTSKTIEGWIKDLNPDRSQGRRKSQ